MSDRTQSVEPSPPPTLQTPTEASTARIELPAEDFALATLFERVPDARALLEPAVANPTDHALLVVRTNEHDADAIERGLEADPAVGMVETVGTHDGGWRFRVTWDGRTRQLIRRLVAESVTILAVHGRSGLWKLRLMAPERETISRVQGIFHDLGCEADFRRIGVFEAGRSSTTITTDQREALTTAFERGYYDIPRGITLVELATELNISHQALSERFRRGHKQLVDSHRDIGDEGGK